MKLIGKKIHKASFFITIISMYHSTACLQQLIDLEQNMQDFVLETKQIHIPSFPGAFNASMIEWHNKILMSFRVRDEKGISTFQIGMVWLDQDFNPLSEARILKINGGNLSSYTQNQDPRLIIVNNRLYILYSNFIAIDSLVTRRMFIAEVHCTNDSFYITDPLCLHPFEKWSERWEKNWVPFNYNEELLLAYSLSPHRILKPNMQTGECSTEHTSFSAINWDWGELRGGTQAIKIDDFYLAFFHSSTYLATTHSHGKRMQHYVMGAYTFSAEPPFEITHISPEPIVGKHFYQPPYYNTWKPLRVVFPMSCIAHEKYIWVTYGRQDFEIWVAKIDKEKLLESLIPCLPGKPMIQHKSIGWLDFIEDYESENS